MENLNVNSTAANLKKGDVIEIVNAPVKEINHLIGIIDKVITDENGEKTYRLNVDYHVNLWTADQLEKVTDEKQIECTKNPKAKRLHMGMVNSLWKMATVTDKNKYLVDAVLDVIKCNEIKDAYKEIEKKLDRKRKPFANDEEYDKWMAKQEAIEFKARGI